VQSRPNRPGQLQLHLERDECSLSATEIAGDEKTMPQVAEAFSRVVGRGVRHESVAMESFDAERRRMNRWFVEEGYSANIPALRKKRPSLMTLEQWLVKGSWATERQRIAIPV